MKTYTDGGQPKTQREWCQEMSRHEFEYAFANGYIESVENIDFDALDEPPFM